MYELDMVGVRRTGFAVHYRSQLGVLRKRLEGPELEGPEHFEKKYQNVPGAAGPAAGAAAASAAASAVCIYYVIIRGRFAPPYKYMIKCIQQKQQQLQQQLQQQPQQLQGHFGNFFENVWPHLAWPHVAFSDGNLVRR